MDTRLSLETEILSWLDEAADTSTTQTNVRNALYQAHVQRLSEERWPFMLWHTPQTFNFVSGQKNYVLHSEYARPFYFRNVTEGEDLRERPARNIQPSYTEEFNRFVLWNRSPVKAHPSTASVLTIVSDSASDSSGKSIRVRGETADGVVTETITPNGTTPVAGVYSYLPGGILQLTKVGTWVGKATVTSNSGAVTNITLLPAETARSYQQIRMLWTPDDTDQIEYQFFRAPSPLDYDDSVPDIPYPHSRILVWDALLLLAAYDSRLDGVRKDVWEKNQERMDLALRQAFLEGQSLRSETQSVIDVEDEF